MFEYIFMQVEKKYNSFSSLLSNQDLKTNLLLFDTIRTFCWLADFVVWFLCFMQIFAPMLNLNFQIINIFCWLVVAICLIGAVNVNWFMILFTTRRLDIDQDDRADVMWKILQSSFWQISFICGSAIAIPLCMTVFPFIQYLRLHPVIPGWTPQMTDMVAGSPFILRALLFGVPIIFTFYLHVRFQYLASVFEQRIKDWMKVYEFKYKCMHDTLTGKDMADVKKDKKEPSIILGDSLETGDAIIQSPVARRQNSIVTGPIGAGKTSAWFLNQILQDINHMIRFMRDYATVSQDPDWNKPFGMQQNYLCGFAVIETTGDLCNTVLRYALKKGIPREKIIYYNPEDPNTPSFSLLNGPVETATQTLTDIMSGLKKNANDFFSMQERTHLTQYIFLLKESSIIDSKPADFGELMKMYNDVYVVVDKREKLRTYCKILENQIDKLKRQKCDNDQAQHKIDIAIEEIQDKLAVNRETLAWFDSNIVSQQYKTGVKLQQEGPHKGEPVYADKNMEFIGGLISQLTELSKKMGLRRVLFRDKVDFSLDDAMKNGYIILCNTAKDMLGETSARMLGQIYSLAFQGATFRRTPNVDPMFPIYQDEFPDYLYDNFTDFAAQARKYNVPLNIGAQSPAQLSKKFGPDFLRTIFSVMLTRATFGDMGYDDALVLSRLFGTHKEAIESINEQDIDLAADCARNRKMISSRLQEVPNISPEEIMGLEKFTMAVRLPGEHRSDVFDRVRVRRITDEMVENDPENFDINGKDKKAYEDMKALEVHTNKDFDNIDKQIIQKIKDGTIKLSTSNTVKSPAKFDQVVKKSSSNAVTDLPQSMDDFEQVFSNQEKEAAFNAVDDSVTKSGNCGNNRLNNNISIANDVPSAKDLSSDNKTVAESSQVTKANKKPSIDDSIKTMNNIPVSKLFSQDSLREYDQEETFDGKDPFNSQPGMDHNESNESRR